MEDLGSLIAKLGADLSDLKRGLAEGRGQLASFQGMAERAGEKVKQALSFVALGAGLYLALSKIKEGFQAAFQAADEFQVTTIGIAATLTNLAKDKSDPGLTLAQNLEFAKEMYEALEEEAAKHFGTAQDLQQAFNILVQKGVVARKEDVQALGLLVDQIKLSTQGMNQQIQIAQELRAIVDGQAKATSAVAMMLKDRIGPDWEKIVAEHREAGDLLQFLASLFPGLQAALEKIQNTYEAQKNTLQSHLKLIGREGLAGLYDDVVDLLKDINAYLKEHKDELIVGIRNAWADLKEVLKGVKAALDGIYDVLVFIRDIMPNIVGWAKAFSKALQIDEANFQMLKSLARGDLAAAQAAALKRAQAEGLPVGPGRGWTPEDILAGRVKVSIPPPSGVPELEDRKRQEEKAATKGHAEDLLKILADYLEAKRDKEVKAAEEALKTLKSEYDLKKAELTRNLEAGLIAAEDYYRQVNQLGADLTRETLAVLDLKIAKEKEAYDLAVKELQARIASSQVSPEAGDLMGKKLLLEHETRLISLNAEKTRTRLEDEKRLVEILQEQIEARQKITDLILDEEGKAAFTELEQREFAILKLLEEQKKRREELLKLLGQAGATPEETAASMARFDVAAGRQLQIARFGEEAKVWAQTIAGGISNLVDSLIQGGRDLQQALHRFFSDLFKQSLEPGFKALKAGLENLFLDLFGSVGKSIANAALGVLGLIGMMFLGGGGGGSFSPSGAGIGVTTHEAVRGIVAGPTSISIGEIGASLADALIPTNNWLDKIERNTRQLSINITGLDAGQLAQLLADYLAAALMQGA
jgi:hypothetical protein